MVLPSDYRCVSCERAREAISAALDGEATVEEQAELARHLDSCPSCERWREQAHALTRRARLHRAAPRRAPVAGKIVEAAQHSGGRRGRRALTEPLMTARVALGLVGLVQLALSAQMLLLGQDRGAPVHVAHEMGSFGVAVAIGLLVAAFRPNRAAGMLPLVGAAAVLLVLTAVVDLAAGRTTFSDEAPHLAVVAGWLLLWRVSVLVPPALSSALSRSYRHLRWPVVSTPWLRRAEGTSALAPLDEPIFPAEPDDEIGAILAGAPADRRDWTGS